MKRMLAMLLVAAICMVGFAALADEPQDQEALKINTLIEDGSFVIQIDAGGDLAWLADDMAQDDSVVKLAYEDNLEGTFVARYEPTGDGDVTVSVRHYIGIACDRVETWDLRVADGAVQEVIGGGEAVSPEEDVQDAYLSGEWMEAETQFTQMTIEKNQERGWDVEIASPMTHGAYIFKTTIYYDCELDSFVYDKGKFWNVPITDEPDPELGEATVAGATGSFTIVPDEQMLLLRWYNAESPENEVIFERADTNDWVTPHEFLGEWVDQDGTCNIDITAREAEDGYVVNVELVVLEGDNYSYIVYAYGCVYDEDSHSLKSISRVVGKGDFEPDSEEEITDTDFDYTDAEFYFDDADMLIWDDKREDVDDAMAFEHTIGWVDPDYIGPGHHFAGVWNDERVSITIEEAGDGYPVVISGSNSAFESTTWSYFCDYDEATDSLVCESDGLKFNTTFSEDGEDEDYEIVYEDGAAVFSLNGDGQLIWDDKKEQAGEGRTFTHVEAEAPEAEEIDYLALVNKLNPLPDGWEDALETVHLTNSVGNDVEVEKRAFDAYVALAADLEQNDGIYIELDSAFRSVAEQQDIMDRFIEKYGADYAAKTVAQSGYSEHHTGLALDLYFRLDGKDVDKNEDMVQHPEIWEKIHAKLAQYGFILRYLEGKEHITGYGYEPWHIRYVGDPAIAEEIMAQPGMTLEVWLGAVNDPDLTIDYGTSDLFSEEELEEAVVQIKCKFASFDGCELHALRYAGDDANNAENLEWLNGLDAGKAYTQCIEFLADFHSPVEAVGAWEADTEYTDYQWWLARKEGVGWQLLSWGY